MSPATSHTAFASGAVRSTESDGYRFDLISPHALLRIAATHKEGADKYGDHNWRRGLPFSDTLNHAMHHLVQYMQGDRTEDHLAHAAWNLHAVMEMEATRPDQDDLYFSPSREK